jgi:UDP-N-acetylglucosamine/UDP-N-acetylgalactosamine 4-epimerase
LDSVQANVSPEQWQRFHFQQGDMTRLADCQQAVRDVDIVLHQAALGSIPRSLANPIATHETNLSGFLNLLVASRDAHVQRLVYASSSSVYGDSPLLPKVENVLGKPLSPYAVSKVASELYAEAFARCYGMPLIGLRYFNVFGARQNPTGAYAAVIPTWYRALLLDEPVFINGDGLTSRDFCFVANVVQANVLAATTDNPAAVQQIYNVALGDRTTLNELFTLIREQVAIVKPAAMNIQPIYRPFRDGDVRHSLADITKIKTALHYSPTHRVADGLKLAAAYYTATVC